MGYFAITIVTNTLGAELSSDAFFSIGALGVHIDDGRALQEAIEAGLIWDYIEDEVQFPKECDIVTLTGFFQVESIGSLEKKLKDILAQYGLECNIIKDIQQVDDKLWYENWKSFYSPISIGKYLIVPAWQEAIPSGQINIKIDPGMAFGTGEHQSTQLALQLMSNLNFQDKRVFDIGCGSGILGIASALSGAKSVRLIDIDELAITASKLNAKLNGLRSLEFVHAGLPKGLVGQADIMLTNLTADLLITYAQDFKRSIKGKGRLIISGIIKERWGQVLQSMQECGFTLLSTIQDADWVAGLLRG